MFYNGTESLLRILLVGSAAYAAMVLLLRLSGKRTLAKMNAFDFVVTIALGSTLSSVLLSKDVALADGVLAFALLVGLQFVITWSSIRLKWMRRMVTGEPTMLVYHGEFLPNALRRARVTESEALAAIRGSGTGLLLDVEAVVLETDGSFSVVRRSAETGRQSLEDVKR